MPYWFDGNNLIGRSSAAARADRVARMAFLSALNNWRRSGGGRFHVWFDGDDPGDMLPPSGIVVRYSAPESADSAICRRLHEIDRPGEVIVVTNDRELSSRCRHAGANIVDWNQFTLKMQSRSAAHPRVVQPTTKSSGRQRPDRTHKIRQTSGDTPTAVDVDDWLSFFGIDKSKTEY